MSTPDVLIVGAGPVGMALAIELSIQGVSFRIVDKAAERSDKSRAIGLHARTLEMLNRYGDLPQQELLSKAGRIRGNALWVGGQRFKTFDGSVRAAASGLTSDTQFPGIFIISQVETENFLAARLDEKGVVVESPVAVQSIVQDDSGVSVALVTARGEEETVRCKYVVGCDGAHSVVRHSMDVQFEGDVYPQDFILADSEYEWEGPSDKSQVFVGDGVALVFPFKDGSARFVVSRPANVATDAEPTLQDIQDCFDTFLPTDASFPKLKLHDAKWVARFHLHHRCATKYRDGRLFVAGDAAHIHSPVGGQGMNTGIQDSVNLGWKLARVLNGQESDSFLDTYHEERWPIGQHLLKETDRLFTFLSSNSPSFTYMRNLLLPHALSSMGSTSDIGPNMMRYFSQLNVKYRRSPIVHTAAGLDGPVRGGFRAPDGQIRMTAGDEIFLHSLLRGPRHHLLLFLTEGGATAVEEAEHKFLEMTRDAQIHVIGTPNSSGSSNFLDESGQLHDRYGFGTRSGYAFIRPDGYVENIGYVDEFDELLKWLEVHGGQ